MQPEALTDRQLRELEYHREHFKKRESLVLRPLSYEAVDQPWRRWWNGHWQMYRQVLGLKPKGKRALVLGCGAGEDAVRIARLGANVFACDLSPEAVSLTRALATQEGALVQCEQMAAEALTYPDDSFDIVIARDILHHVDIPRTTAELLRVTKPGGTWVINEIYSHTATDIIRQHRIVTGFLYPRLKRFVYGTTEPYITPDERKLSQEDLRQVRRCLGSIAIETYFNFIVTRLIPDTWLPCAKLDRLVLLCLSRLGHFLGGRILLVGSVTKKADSGVAEHWGSQADHSSRK